VTFDQAGDADYAAAPQVVQTTTGCDSPSTWYRDADGDGYGNSTISALSCPRPAGYVATGDDCDDADPTTYPNAPEVNDGRDNQCPGNAGYGAIDEISGTSGFNDPTNQNKFCWVTQAEATSYQVVRSSQADFTAGCAAATFTDSCLVDPFAPPGGQGYYYLVRALTPRVGSWGLRSDGTERMGGCLPP